MSHADTTESIKWLRRAIDKHKRSLVKKYGPKVRKYWS